MFFRRPSSRNCCQARLKKRRSWVFLNNSPTKFPPRLLGLGGGGGIGVVRQRLDGFIAADADHRGGWLETPPRIFKGSQLRLNIDTGAMGTAFVELRDAGGKHIPGFTLADCEEIGGNFVDQRVYWKGKTDVSPLAGRP